MEKTCTNPGPLYILSSCWVNIPQVLLVEPTKGEAVVDVLKKTKSRWLAHLTYHI